MTVNELLETFDSMEDWDERCDFLIDIGFELPDFPEEARIEENRVRGCQSNVWLLAEVRENSPATIEIVADSDSIIVRGLIAILLTVFSGRTPQDILSTDIQSIFERLGLDRHLSSTRRNGLNGMVKKICRIAEQTA